MRTYLYTLIGLFLTSITLAQSPQALSYQAELRNTDGSLLSDQDITLLFNIRQGSTTGTVAYEEFHDVTTSSLGKVALEIGRGTPVSGSFANIPWGDNSFFLEVSLDGDTISNTELLSVPFALYALESGSTTSGGFELPFSGTFNNPSIPAFELINTSSNSGNLISLINNGDLNAINIDNSPSGVGIQIDNDNVGLIINTTNTTNGPSVIINHENDNSTALIIDVENTPGAPALALEVEGGDVNMDQNLNIGGILDIGSDLNVGEDIVVADDLIVGDRLVVQDDLEVTDDTSIGGFLSVSQGAELGGNVEVLGTLSKGGGSFKIDHPLDPYNKYLYHSFVESPDMMNIYNGIVTTDESGIIEVDMPDWFTTLNMEFRYQLTLIGAFGQAIIKEKMNDLGTFIIQTNIPNAEVSWQVTGIRQDAWAQHNRIPVEEDKVGEQKGQLLHPNAFNMN